MKITRLRAAGHELRCWECRVTWRSWAQRLVGMERGFRPRLPKRERALVARARRAEDTVERVRALRDDWWNRPGWSEAGDALDAALDAPESPAAARSGTSAATEASGGAREAQEARE